MSNVFNNAEVYTFKTPTEILDQPSVLVFHQRVYSVSKGWCYYSTTEAPDPDPTTTQTSPEHSDDISDHQVISVTTAIQV